ncbi:MAG: DUF4469 domain-containing protein [Anaerolineales bacterium]|nr:DUF4469 domain-containing protein [Anaerolineales bacterium]
MPINFSLHQNNLNTETTQFRAVVHSSGTMDYEQIVERVVKQNSTVTRSDVMAALNDFFAAIEDALLLGYNVNTPVANFRASIKGGFDSELDGFTAGRNTVEASISPGPRLRKTMQDAQVQKQESSERLPRPLYYTDLNSGELNGPITPGGMGQLTGHRLRFDPADPTQGIFFINGSVTRVSIAGKNDPSELMFLVPATLTPGDYALEVRAASNGTLQIGLLKKTLTVS